MGETDNSGFFSEQQGIVGRSDSLKSKMFLDKIHGTPAVTKKTIPEMISGLETSITVIRSMLSQVQDAVYKLEFELDRIDSALGPGVKATISALHARIDEQIKIMDERVAKINNLTDILKQSDEQHKTELENLQKVVDRGLTVLKESGQRHQLLEAQAKSLSMIVSSLESKNQAQSMVLAAVTERCNVLEDQVVGMGFDTSNLPPVPKVFEQNGKFLVQFPVKQIELR